MKNSADQGGCYPQRPKAEVDNTLRDLQNSSHPTKAEFNICFIIHSKYFLLLKGVSPFRFLFFRSPNITQPCPQVFSVNDSILIGSFSNDDGDGRFDALKKMNLYSAFEFRDSVNLFRTPIGLKICSGQTCTHSDHFQRKIPKISHWGSRSPKYMELGHFTLLFCRGRQRNYEVSKRTCTAIAISAHQTFCLVTFPLPSPSWFAKTPYYLKLPNSCARANVHFFTVLCKTTT